MTTRVEELIRLWADESLTAHNQRLLTLEKRLYCSYEPSMLPKPSFWPRLAEWLNCVAHDDDARKTLFRLVEEIFFVGPSEFMALYQYAYNGPIARWLIDTEKIDICAADAVNALKQALDETWFCPISDSMKINTFYHVNNIPAGSDFRPDWRSLAEFGDENKIQQYCAKNRIKRLVLLEDFVGGGSQMQTAVNFAASLQRQVGPNKVSLFDILVVPLIICPRGMETAAAFEKAYPDILKFEPIVAIPKASFVSLTPSAEEPAIHAEVRKLAEDTYPAVSDGIPIGKRPPYHWLGYPDDKPTGGLIVMHTNTPDNSLPLIHWPSSNWKPLFPRHSRV